MNQYIDAGILRRYTSYRTTFVTIAVLLAVLLTVSACGRGGGGAPAEEPSGAVEAEATATRSPREVPTMPAAQFAQPTTMIDPTKVAERGSTPEVEVVDPAFGAQVYVRLCADCHGEALEGIPGEAEPIEVYALNREELTDLLRTGGGYGPTHLFGLDKVSPEGIASLQAHLESLGESE